ncbi:hypothetical protein TI05_16825, partial [Achromatium sp. WMS3]
MLTAQGYNPGPVDGLMGSKTRTAIRRFEQDKGFAVSGEINTNLLKTLRTVGHKVAETNRQLVIPDEARNKYPDLIPQILASPSMDDDEKNYWFSVLPIMTKDQIAELRSILIDEKKRLGKLAQEKQHSNVQVDNSATQQPESLRQVIQVGHTSKVTAVEISPNGKLAISVDKNGLIKLWDVETGRELRTLPVSISEESHSAAVAFSADSRLALSGTAGMVDIEINLWEVETGRKLRTISWDSGGGLIESVAFLQNTYIAVFYDNGLLKMRDILTGQDLHPFKNKDTIFSCDSHFCLLASDENKSLELFDMRSGVKKHTFLDRLKMKSYR